MFGTFIFKHAQATKSHGVGIKSANSICCKKPGVEGHPGENTVLGDIQFVPNDACIVDLRIGLPNEVPGLFWSFNFHPGQTILSSTGSCGSSYRAISCIGHCPAILRLGGREAEGRKVLWPARGGDSVPFYGCGEVDEDRGATSEYVPTPNPSTTTEHKTLSVSEDEYTKFFQYQVAKLLPGLSSVIRGKSSRSDTVVARVVNQIPFSRKWRRRKVKRRWAGLDSKQARRFTKLV
ncbi:hypothetical protein V6N13_075665 [Hibiscus sabdariffa]